MTPVADRVPGSLGGTYLTFFLAGEEYGIAIRHVQEIISSMPVTRVPRTSPFIRGVINLRGKVVPVVDLREKFGTPPADEPEPVMIVVQVDGVQVGIVADRVSEVASLSAADIDPTPDFGDGFRTELLLGLGKSNGRLRLLLDIERVLSSAAATALTLTPTVAPGA